MNEFKEITEKPDAAMMLLGLANAMSDAPNRRELGAIVIICTPMGGGLVDLQLHNLCVRPDLVPVFMESAINRVKGDQP
jgi:hypothetical protein